MPHSNSRGLRCSVIGLGTAMQIMDKVVPEDLRPIDYKEFLDATRHRFTDYVEEFRVALAATLGFLDHRCTSVLIEYVDSESNTHPAFIATSHHFRTEGCQVLSGFGWESADQTLSIKEKWKITKFTVEELILKSEHSKFVCWCHRENHHTIKTWEWIGKSYQRLAVTFTQIPNAEYLRIDVCVSPLQSP